MVTIGKLAVQAGVSVETLRFYQRKGLLNVPEPSGRIRHYDESHLRRVTFIKSAQAAGFSLKEITQLLAMDASQDHHRARELALQRLSAIDKQLMQLQIARTSLKQLVHDCEHNPHKPCPIIASFVDTVDQRRTEEPDFSPDMEK